MTVCHATQLQHVYQRLHNHYGALAWWPAETAYEVIVGAILTQNTAWTNVEQALARLKAAACLTPQALMNLPTQSLEELIRPAGFFRQKSRYLRAVTACLLEQHQGRTEALCSGPLDSARQHLLSLPGVGPETADSILLYAANRPSFVVDAYTRRLFTRLGLLDGNESYDAIRQMFMSQLPHDTTLFNLYHALIVEHVKACCRKRAPLCKDCPLLSNCPFGQLDGTRNEGRGTR